MGQYYSAHGHRRQSLRFRSRRSPAIGESRWFRRDRDIRHTGPGVHDSDRLPKHRAQEVRTLFVGESTCSDCCCPWPRPISAPLYEGPRIFGKAGRAGPRPM